MKKFLFLVFLLMLVIPVKGLESDNNVIRKYKYYRLNKVLGPIVSKDEVSDKFPLIDENQYFEEQLSELLPVKPLEKDGRKIYEYNGYHYLKTPKINTIEIKVDKDEIINDIKIESEGKEIIYESSSDVLSGDDYVRYDLNGDYDLNNLIITGKSGDGKDTHSFYIYFKNGDKLVSQLNTIAFMENITLYGQNSSIKANAYEDIYSLDKLDVSSDLTYKGEIKLYQYQDYKYQSYKLEKEYYDQYLTEPFEDYIYRDESDYIDVPIINSDFSSVNTIKELPIQEETNKITPKNKEINFMNVETPILEQSSIDKSFKVKLPTQYQHVLKVDNNKTTSSVANTSHFFDYLKILILIILLILTLKLKNKVKEYSRW